MTIRVYQNIAEYKAPVSARLVASPSTRSLPPTVSRATSRGQRPADRPTYRLADYYGFKTGELAPTTSAMSRRCVSRSERTRLAADARSRAHEDGESLRKGDAPH